MLTSLFSSAKGSVERYFCAITMSPAVAVRLAMLFVLCGAVLADRIFSLEAGKTHQVKKGHHKKQKQHPNRWPNLEERHSPEDPWNDSEDAESVANSEEDGDPWDAYTSLPTVRMIHKGGLLPPVLAHAIPHNLSEDESLEPVTICGPGWHAPLDKPPSRGQRTLEQKTQLSFSGVQFFFGNVVPPKLASGSSADQGDIDNFKINKPSEDGDAPFIVS